MYNAPQKTLTGDRVGSEKALWASCRIRKEEYYDVRFNVYCVALIFLRDIWVSDAGMCESLFRSSNLCVY